MIKAFTVSILSLFFSSVQIAFIDENTEGHLEKSGTFEINSGHLYRKGDYPGKHGTNGNPTVETRFSSLHCVGTGFEAHPASYSVGTGIFPLG
jgi:hypothetical protein